MFRSLRSFFSIGGKKKPLQKDASYFRHTRIKFDTLEDRTAPAAGAGTAVSFNVNPNGSTLFEISNATGAEGPTAAPFSGWDSTTLIANPLSTPPTPPSLNFSATPTSPFNVTLQTRLNSGDGNTAGPMDNFNPAQNYAWRFVKGDNPNLVTTGTFNPAAFNLNTSGTFLNSFTGTFSIEYRDTAAPAGPDSLFVVYTAPGGAAPVTSNSTAATNEDTAATGNLVSTGSNLTYLLVTQPTSAQGVVTINPQSGAFTFTPAANFNGSASFTFKTNNGLADSNTSTVAITVAAVNDAPVANNGTLSATEDTAATGSLSATDVDNTALTYSIVSQTGANGTVTITNATTGAYSYTPASNFNGPASFTFKANDGTSDSTPATVTINVAAINDAPVAAPGTLTTSQGVAKTGTLSAIDIEGSPLTYSIVSQTNAQGTVAITNAATGAYTYTPNPAFNGTATFTFKANDGGLDSNTATVTITIAANGLPVAQNGTLTTAEDTAATGTLAATDPDGSPLTFSIVSQSGAHGTVTITNTATGAYSFTPEANYNGPASFTFKANDGTSDSAAATVNITITPINDVPVASAGTLTTAEDTAATGTLAATDVDNATLTYSIVSQANAQGTIAITNAATGAYSYTPAANFNGTATFTFKANDGSADSNTGTVTITVTAVNDAPVANNGTLTSAEDATATGTLSATDIDSTALTYSIVSQTNAHGTVTITNAATGAYSFVPTANYNGPATFTFKANDGSVDSNTGTVTLTITPVNDSPVANAGTLTTAEDTAATGTLVANDADNTPVTYSIVSPTTAAQGTVTITNATTGAYSYTPAANFNGTATFTFRANDGIADSNTATVSITVTPVNDAPVANNGTLITPPGTAATGTLVATDIDSPTLTYTIVTPPPAAQGTVAITNATTGAYSFTPAAGFTGTTSLTFKANDGAVDSNTATVTISVAPNGAAITTTTIVSSANPSVYGSPVTFTATVSATSGTPTGTVNFFDGATQIGSGTLSGGTASFQISTLSAATHNITAVYAGVPAFVTSTSANLSQVVNKKSLTVSGITATGKVYDGKTTVALNTGSAALNGVVGADNVTLGATSAVGTMDSKNVGVRTVTISGLTLAGTAAGNYQITPAPTTTVTVTPKTVTITGLGAQNKVYDGTTAATLQVLGKTGIQGVVAGDRVNYNVAGAVGTFSDPNVGNGKTVTITGVVLSSPPTANNDAANYIVAPITTTANITPRPLTVTANNRTKTQGQALTFAGTEFTSSGLVGGQTIGSATMTSTGSPAAAAAGSYTILISGATGGTFNLNNYNVTYVPGTLTVS